MTQPLDLTSIELLKVDRDQAYLLYATFCGSPVPVAKALGISPQAVLRMAIEGGWAEKLRPIIELHAGATSPQSVERAVNRALNWTQANRLRIIVERVLRNLYDLSGEELLEAFSSKSDPDKSNISFRALADLAACLEKAQAATYAALGDTASERAKRGPEESSSVSASAMQAQIAQAMDSVMLDSSPRAQLFDAQLEIAHGRRLAAITAKPA